MLRTALTEIRLYPGRFLATLIAIAISVAFMTGSVTYVSSLQSATAASMNLAIAKSDIVIENVDNPVALRDRVKNQVGVKDVDVTASLDMTLKANDKTTWLTMHSMPSESFSWFTLKQGRKPSAPNEVVLDLSTMKILQVKIGDQVRDQFSNTTYKVVGVADGPTPLLDSTSAGFMHPSVSGISASVLVQVDSSTTAKALAKQLQPIAANHSKDAHVSLTADIQADALKSLVGGFDALKIGLMGFASVSVLVGMIIIANTFTILLTQRRQQIGLLRAIGASGSQVRRKFLAESLVLGTIGSLSGVAIGVGLAAATAAFTGVLQFGLVVPWIDTLAAILVGIFVTVIASIVPSNKATRVSPMEALQTVPTAQQAKRITIVRIVVCSLFGLAGVIMTINAVTAKSDNFSYALVAGFAITFAVLGSSQLYIPHMARAIGRVFSFGRPTLRLASENVIRNPQRTASTATALMLAIGLIVTLQVTVSTMSTSAKHSIENRFPISLQFYSQSGKQFDKAAMKGVQAIPGVTKAEPVLGADIGEWCPSDKNVCWGRAVTAGDAMTKVAPNSRQAPPTDAQAYVEPHSIPESYKGKPFTIHGPKGSVNVTLVPSWFARNNVVILSEKNLERLGAPLTFQEIWVATSDELNLSDTIAKAQTFVTDHQIELTGSLPQKYMINQIVLTMMTLLSALLGVAVLIALVGVANTLGLSVLERTRESALLRALGMQKARLRAMLFGEAVLITTAGTLVGVVFGAFFGWLATTSMVKVMPSEEPLVFSVDPWWTIGLLAVVYLAATLASVLPGRRAANAAPTAALQE